MQACSGYKLGFIEISRLNRSGAIYKICQSINPLLPAPDTQDGQQIQNRPLWRAVVPRIAHYLAVERNKPTYKEKDLELTADSVVQVLKTDVRRSSPSSTIRSFVRNNLISKNDPGIFG
jgi:hypothetical protein